MPNWTPEQHADARAWLHSCDGKDTPLRVSRALAGALDEIERLQAEVGKGLDAAKAAINLCDTYSEHSKGFEAVSRRALDHASEVAQDKSAWMYNDIGEITDCAEAYHAGIDLAANDYPPLFMWKGGQRPKKA